MVKKQTKSVNLMAIAAILLFACQSLATESKIVITNTEIVPVPVAKRPFSQSYSTYLQHYFDQESFKPAGKTWSDIGAVNKYATVVSNSRLEHPSFKYLLDTDKPNGTVANRLRLDINSDGKFNDNADLKISSMARNRNFEFNKDSLAININGKKATIAVAGRYEDYRQLNSNYRCLRVYLGSALEGRATLGGRKYLIQIVDCSGYMGYGLYETNFNGKKKISANTSDAVRIYEINEDGKISDKPIWENHYGLAAKIGDEFYTITRKSENHDIHIEKSKIKSYPVTFDMPGAYICATSSGLGGYRRIYCQGGKTNYLPAGIFEIERLGIKRGNWEMRKDYSNKLRMSVYPNNENTVDLPLPLKIAANVRENGINNFIITSALTDQNGGKFSLSQDRRSVPLKLKITGENGQIIKKANFSYQWGGPCPYTWRVPKTIKGEVTIECFIENCPFELESIKAKVRIGE